MGDQQISPLSTTTKIEFMRHLLRDIEALEHMIENGIIESGITRIGAEQELCLLKPNLRPANTGPEILASINEPHFTAELAQWNLEINLDPQGAGPGCLHAMNRQLRELLALADEHSRQFDSRIVLTGILPTIRKSDLDFQNMSPNPRYRVLDSIIKQLRGEDFSLYIEGVDEINLKHGSILFEACNTSFQVHLQVDSNEFADKYNWAQILAGPVLAACVNSPVLLGKELWSESRIALFRQSIDIRHAGNDIRDKQPRVAFGYDWIQSSAAEIFKNDMAFYQLLIFSELESEHAMDVLSKGKTPSLRAMNVHNGTLYKWNRACYGVGNGKPHLRIENRYLPAGPTPHDEMANVAFWIGLMEAMPEKCSSCWHEHFKFQEVRCNFLKAARNGLSNEMTWFGETMDAGHLILDHLLPMAESGLQSLGVPKSEYAQYLNTIEQRIVKKQTGASWIIDSARSLREKNTVYESMLMITRYMQENCLSDKPVHQWEIPKQSTLVLIPNRYERVDSIMVTNLVTVLEDELIDFAETLMQWNDVHHLPVESANGQLVGIVSARDIERFRDQDDNKDALVAACMTTDIVSVAPEDSLGEAEQTMLDNGFGSMPVVRNNCVVGLITANDIRAMHQKLKSE